MLVYLGLISNENMQNEGFWYDLFTGVFKAATIHSRKKENPTCAADIGRIFWWVRNRFQSGGSGWCWFSDRKTPYP